MKFKGPGKHNKEELEQIIDEMLNEKAETETKNKEDKDLLNHMSSLVKDIYDSVCIDEDDDDFMLDDEEDDLDFRPSKRGRTSNSATEKKLSNLKKSLEDFSEDHNFNL